MEFRGEGCPRENFSTKQTQVFFASNPFDSWFGAGDSNQKKCGSDPQNLWNEAVARIAFGTVQLKYWIKRTCRQIL